jgi:H+/Cl- antiporter ClcA
MTVTARPYLLAAYLPTRRNVLIIALWTVVGGVLWFAIFSWSVCYRDGCASALWFWQALVSLVLGLAFSCFGCAVVASAECVRHMLHRAPRWPVPWPQPLTIAVVCWFVQVFAVLALQLIFRYHGVTSSVAPWYLGLLPMLFK